MKEKEVRLFLRFSIALGFLSAVADRLGIWNPNLAAWGNWENFVSYTQQLNPLVPENLIPSLALVASLAEVIFATALLIGYKTDLFAKLSGVLLLVFAVAMTFSTGIKGALDYSVYIASAAAFAISQIKMKCFELDLILNKQI